MNFFIYNQLAKKVKENVVDARAVVSESGEQLTSLIEDMRAGDVDRDEIFARLQKATFLIDKYRENNAHMHLNSAREFINFAIRDLAADEKTYNKFENKRKTVLQYMDSAKCQMEDMENKGDLLEYFSRQNPIGIQHLDIEEDAILKFVAETVHAQLKDDCPYVYLNEMIKFAETMDKNEVYKSVKVRNGDKEGHVYY